MAAAVRRTPNARRYTVNLVDPAKEREYDGIAQIWLDADSPSAVELLDLEPDNFTELVQVPVMARGHEIRIVD